MVKVCYVLPLALSWLGHRGPQGAAVRPGGLSIRVGSSWRWDVQFRGLPWCSVFEWWAVVCWAQSPWGTWAFSHVSTETLRGVCYVCVATQRTCADNRHGGDCNGICFVIPCVVDGCMLCRVIITACNCFLLCIVWHAVLRHAGCKFRHDAVLLTVLRI